MSELADAPWLNDAPVTPGLPDAPWVVDQRTQMLEQPQVNAPGGIINSIRANLQASSTGLILRGKAPDVHMSPDAAWYERAAGNIAGVVGDLPAMIVGGVAGSAAGPIGTGAGALAVPTAIRESLMTAYEMGAVDTWEELWEITKAGATGGIKGAVLGGATAGAGRFVRGLGTGPATQIGAVGAQITTLATVGSALEGRLPTAQDFLDAAIVVGGMHAATTVVGRLRNIYAKTGVPPEQVAVEAMKDPALKAELAKSDEIPTVYRPAAAVENAKAAVPDPATVSPEAVTAFMETPFSTLAKTPTTPKIPTVVRLEYINSAEEIVAARTRLTELFEEQIQKQHGGRVSNTQSQAEADLLMDTLGRRVPLEGVSRAEILARQMMAEAAAKDAVQAAKEFKDLGESATIEQRANFKARVARAAMLEAEAEGALSEGGRVLQVIQSTAKSRKTRQEMHRAIEELGSAADDMVIAERLSQVDNATAALKVAKAAVEATLTEKIATVFKASIFSGPTSWMANIMGNKIMMGLSVPTRAIAAGIGRLRGSTPGERVELGEAHALLMGMQRGALDGLRGAGEILTWRREVDAAQKIEHKRAFKGTFGKVLESISFRPLSAGDFLTRTMVERAELYAQAYRTAYKENLHPETREFRSRVESIVQNPEAALGETAAKTLAEAVEKAGRDATFTTPLGARGQMFNRMVQGSLWELLFPARRTPINLFKRAAEMLPGINLLMESARTDLSGKNGKIAQDMAFARMIIGGTVMMVVAAAVKEGTITGGLAVDPDKRRAQLAAGIQPYSIKIGDSYYSYARLEPLGRMMSAVADASEIMNELEDDSQDKLDVAAVIVASIGNATVSQNYLSGLANAINAVTVPERYGDRWTHQYAGSLVPSLIAQPATALDPHAREVNSVFEAIQARIPIWREELLPKRNTLTGQPVEPERLFPLAPVSVTRESKDKVLTEAARLGIRLPIAPKKVHVGRGTGRIGDVEITPEARNAYTQKQGEFAHDLLARIVGSEGWDRIPDIVKEGIYSKVLRSARQQAALVALPPEARAAEIQRIADEMAAQLNR
jgi:hypothetical protein